MRKIYTLLLSVLFTVCAWAQLPYNTTMTQNHFNSSSTVINKSDANWDSGIRLGTTSNWNPGNWSDHYVIIALNQQSIPYQLKFKYKVNFGISSNPNWYVDESPDNSNWTRVWSNESRNTSWSDQQVLTLSKSTKYIKLCFSGNYSGTFADVIVSDQSYVNNPKQGDNTISSLNFGSNTISSGIAEQTFDVEWCNVPEMTVTSSNDQFFAVSPGSFGGKAKYGTQTVTVSYNRNKEVGSHDGTITITNGSVTKTVTLSGVTTKRDQAIHWNADLIATNYTMNAGDELTGAALAVADNEEAVITYVSDNTDVIAVSEDGKTVYAIDNGTANVTVTATGNDIYNEGTDTKLFTVTSNKKQVITWDQNFMSLKTNANPKTIELTATATSGGEVTYALEEGSDNCVTLSGSTLTITGTPGVAYIIATQAGGEINDEIWIAATARKQIKVRDPNAACDEYALADQSFTFEKGDKTTMAEKEYSLVGKPTALTFTAKWGGLKYTWSEQQEMYVDQYANFGSGLEWRQITSFKLTKNNTSYGPIALDETATKIRFRSGEYGEQNVSNISVPRKKEMVVSETAIVAEAERNVKWTKTISVSRSNIDVVDIAVVSDDPECAFEVSKTSIGSDCADRSTETFDVTITPHERDSVYTGTITITDGKAVPTTHVITLSVKAVGFNQTINGFVLPENCKTVDTVMMPDVTTTSGLTEIQYFSSDSAIAYVENNQLVILQAGTVEITAYQAGDDKYNPAEATQTIVIGLSPVTILETPRANDMATGEPLSTSQLIGGKADVDGSFAWVTPEAVPAEGLQTYEVLFTPVRDTYYATATTSVQVNVMPSPATYGEYNAQFCAGDTVEYAGKKYFEATTDSVLLDVQNIYGGDSIVIVTVNVLQLSFSQEALTIVYGTDTAWNGMNLNDSTVGEHIVTYVTTNVAGCDSTVTLYLNVEKQQTVEVPVDLTFCQGDTVEYRGKAYYEAAEDTIQAIGEIRDTLYVVKATVLQPSFSQEALTIVYGTDTAWNGIALNDSTVGEHTLVYVTKNSVGCDSTVTLYLNVEKQQTVEVPVDLTFCQGDTVEYRGKAYYEAAEDTIPAIGEIRDTLYVVKATVLQPSFSQEALTIVYGTDTAWNGIALNDSTVGEHIVTYVTTNVAGCDSTVTLYLNVEKQQTVETYYPINVCNGDSAEYRGKWYYEAGADTVLVEGAISDTLVYVTIAMLQADTMILDNDTLYVGDTLFIEANVWYFDGVLLTDTAYDMAEESAFDLIRIMKNEYGCDSTIVRHIVVVAKPEPDTPTAIEGVKAAEKAVKEFRNGIIYIRRGEHIYTTSGLLVK